MITNVKTVAVYVSDQEAALRFYTEKLGFEVRRNEPMGAQGSWLEEAPPGAETRVVIYPRSMMVDWEARKPSIVLGCQDTEAAHRKLSQRGVDFIQKPTKMAWGIFAIFKDLDGNEFVPVAAVGLGVWVHAV